MSRMRPFLPQLLILVFLGAVALALGVSLGGAAFGETALELTVRARGMAFYIDGSDAPNPALVLPADRRVRLVFVNEDRGIEHDLVLPQLDLRTRILRATGSRQTITFRTPVEPTRSRYNCSLHPAMMQGEVEIR